MVAVIAAIFILFLIAVRSSVAPINMLDELNIEFSWYLLSFESFSFQSLYLISILLIVIVIFEWKIIADLRTEIVHLKLKVN